MRTVRQFCAASLLTLTLALTVFAGELQTPGMTSAPPLQTLPTGDIQPRCASSSGQKDMPLLSDTDSVAEMTSVLLVNVLSMF